MEKWLPGLWSVSFALLLDWRRSRAGVDEIGFKRVIRQFETVEDAAPLQLARWVQMTDRISGFGVDDAFEDAPALRDPVTPCLAIGKKSAVTIDGTDHNKTAGSPADGMIFRTTSPQTLRR
ncbi:hypothetical protein IWX49DRAFT_556970 [Phyllosticta citricarpa]|uniref:Uncharacterized protein n=2 Tax=Phyllosticta TaxID=121621 RepID=A0ABR1LEI4_9PEZI